jgi:hypothetical protein
LATLQTPLWGRYIIVVCSYTVVWQHWNSLHGQGESVNHLYKYSYKYLMLKSNLLYQILQGGHAVALWLTHYATSWKVMGLRPDEVNEFFFQFT